MQALIERIRREAVYLGRGIIKVDGFLNHQLDPDLSAEMGRAFAEHLSQHEIENVTKILTAEVSGIMPALATGMALGVPVVYARKKQPITMSKDVYSAEAPSRTKGNLVKLIVSPEYLQAGDRVVIIDDFLATGQTLAALASIIEQADATLLGIGCVIEKAFENGRVRLADLSVPVFSLARVDVVDDALLVS